MATHAVIPTDVPALARLQQRGLIIGVIGLAAGAFGLFTNRDNFANTDAIRTDDKLDQSRFQGGTAAIKFERNSLNRRQYATTGRRVDLSFRGVTGREKYEPGSTAGDLTSNEDNHQWIKANLFMEQYFNLNKVDTVGARTNAWGFMVDLMASTQGSFSTYRSSLTNSSTFLPLPDSRTIFLDRYRGTAYAAAGLRYVKAVVGSLEWRTEGYIHTLVRPWERQEGNPLLADRGDIITRPYLTLMTGFQYQTPVGPAALQFIHDDEKDHPFGVFAHIGFVLFRDRSLD